MAARRAECAGHLRQIGIGLSCLHGDRGTFPAGMSFAQENGRYQWAGWQAWLLPYVEQMPLYEKAMDDFRREPNVWANLPHVGLGTVVPLYVCALDGRVTEPVNSSGIEVAFTSYLGNEGTNQYSLDGVLFVDSRVSITQVSDGTSNTLLVGERPPASSLSFGWWYAGIGLDDNGACDMVGGAREVNRRRGRVRIAGCDVGPHQFRPGKVNDVCDLFHYWSLHPGGANFLFIDGAVRFLSYSANSVLPDLSTRAGAEAVTIPE